MEDNKFYHSLYAGVMGGYGSTTWTGLVPLKEDQNIAMSLSTPIGASEGGVVWGFFAGYELIPTFAIEAGYTRYQNAKIVFDPISIFTYEHDELTEFVSKTETVSLMGKFMLFIPHTKIKAYSSLGMAALHREDMLLDAWRITPTFGAGINYDINPHIIGEFGANYTAGYGEAQLNPTDVYFPFLYSVFLKLAYRF